MHRLGPIGLKILTTLLLTSGFATLLLVKPLSAFAADETIQQDGSCNLPVLDEVITSPVISVLTLNLAHGRKDAFNQMLQKTSTTRQNLEEIADYFTNSGADLIALQEADAPSRWSGKFNHVEFVSLNSPYPCSLHASHAQKYMYDFGTALLSKVPFSDSVLHTFMPSPPTTNKGFVMGEVLWNPAGKLAAPINVSVISVHLDFSRKTVRESQIQEMRDLLPDIATPLIILGDFNTDWFTDESALKTIVENGDLKVYQPESKELGTYKKGKHRLDWILISKDLEFVSYQVPQIILSDHQPVLARLKLVDPLSTASDSNAHE
jgi:endonuclease/exonuclease/phosphatase family metal-dependent hydrolase